jgi:hypothetical protein
VRLTTLQVYEQMFRMGPRRSGRTVGNIIAAVAAKENFGRSTIVVAQTNMRPQIRYEMNETLGIPVEAQPDIVTLQNVTDARGPFFVDHYATDRVIDSFTRELAGRDAEITYLKRRLQEYEGRFS